MIDIKYFTFNGFRENTFLLFDKTKECVIIDPGCNDPYEEKQLVDFIEDHDLTPKIILNTHCHIDHVMGNKFIVDRFNIPLLFNKIECPVLNAAVGYADACNIQYTPSPAATDYISEADTIEFGKSKLSIVFVPGHSPGHIAFEKANNPFLS